MPNLDARLLHLKAQNITKTGAGIVMIVFGLNSFCHEQTPQSRAIIVHPPPSIAQPNSCACMSISVYCEGAMVPL